MMASASSHHTPDVRQHVVQGGEALAFEKLRLLVG